MSGAGISRKDCLFIPWLLSIPHTNHWLSVQCSGLQASPRKSLYVLRAAGDMRGCVMGIRSLCCWELGMRPRSVGEEAKKGAWGCRAAGILQENLAAGNVRNATAEEEQAGSCCRDGLPRRSRQAEGGVTLEDISSFLLSSPESEKQTFSCIVVATMEAVVFTFEFNVCFSDVKDKPVGQICR